VHLIAIHGWHVHLELDLNIWLIGVSWNRRYGEIAGDIGIYAGPLNFQIEHYDRGVHGDPTPDDDDDDDEDDDDLSRLGEGSSERLRQLDRERPRSLTDLTRVDRSLTGLPWDLYVTTRSRCLTDDPRLYVPACDCPVETWHDLQPVVISPRVRLIRGAINSTPDFKRLKIWIKLNKPVLLGYWNGDIEADEALDRLGSR
jgi:hypothetical protein